MTTTTATATATATPTKSPKSPKSAAWRLVAVGIGLPRDPPPRPTRVFARWLATVTMNWEGVKSLLSKRGTRRLIFRTGARDTMATGPTMTSPMRHRWRGSTVLSLREGGGSMPLRRIPLPAIGGAMRWTTICWQSSRRFPSGRLVKIASTAMVRATMERRPMI